MKKSSYSRGYVALMTVIIFSFVMTAIVVAMSKETVVFQTFIDLHNDAVHTKVSLLSCVSVVQEKIAEDGVIAVFVSPVVLPDGYRCDVEMMHTQPFVTARVRVGSRTARVSVDPIHATVMSFAYDLL